LALYIAGTAAPNWCKISTAGGSGTLGLWSSTGIYPAPNQSTLMDCAGGKVNGATVPDGVKMNCQKTVAGEAFLIMACIMCGFVTILAFLLANGQMESMSMVSPILGATTTVFGVIGFALVTSVMLDTGFQCGATSKLDASAGVTIVAWVLSLVGTVLGFVWSSKTAA